VLAGCGVTATAQQQGDESTSTTTASGSEATDTSPIAVAAEGLPRETPVTVPLSLYLVHDATDAAGSSLSSQRTEEDLEIISRNMGVVWSQANVVFDPVNIETVQVPPDVLEAIALGLDTTAFFDQVGDTFEIPNASAVNGFYVRTAGQANGFAPIGSRVFFVIDEPSVNDERVSSHEVGHILGLHHQLDDPETLMFSGTNGTILNEDEIVVARYTAQGVLDGVR